jgi:hypothetical protein
MPVEVRSTKDVTTNGIKMVVFGYSGVGKTFLSTTLNNTIIISAERGLLSLADHDLPYIQVDNVKDIGNAYDFLKGNDDYDTIYIDSLSEITETVVHEFRKSVKDGRQAYMKLAERMLPMIRRFRDLDGKNVVFTAKAKRIENEYTGITTIEPMLPGQVVPLNLPYLVDELLYMEVDRKGKRIIHCQPSFGVLAKDRSGKLNDQEPADLSKIFAKILTKKKEKEPIP